MNETLIDALSGIADAIRAKGIAGTMNAWEMPDKIAAIPTGGGSKYGIILDGIIGDVDENGALQRMGEPFSFSTSEIVSIPPYYFQSAFNRKGLTSIDLPMLTTIGEYTFESTAVGSTISSLSMPELSAIPDKGMMYAFRNCSALAYVNLDSVVSVDHAGMMGTFYNDPAISSFSMPSLESMGNQGMYRCLSGDIALEEVCLSSLSSVGQSGLYECFMGCSALKKVTMPLSYAATDSMQRTFSGCSSLEYVDFSNALSAPSIYSTTFANTNDTWKAYVPWQLRYEWSGKPNWSSIGSHVVAAPYDIEYFVVSCHNWVKTLNYVWGKWVSDPNAPEPQDDEEGGATIEVPMWGDSEYEAYIENQIWTYDGAEFYLETNEGGDPGYASFTRTGDETHWVTQSSDVTYDVSAVLRLR